MSSVKKNQSGISNKSGDPLRMVAKEPHASRSLSEARKPLPVPDSARALQRVIIARLESLVNVSCSALDPEFQDGWREVLSLADRYQEEIVRHAGLIVTCTSGCSSCCHHWVEDVNSFEAEAIAAWLKRSAKGRIDTIIDRCNRDGASLSQLNALVEAKLAVLDPASAEEIDQTDLLLASFYRLRKPCPLLDTNNRSCLVYPLRPLTCRMYVSFSSPVKCSPGFEAETDIPTYLFGLEEQADMLIDRLHFKFMRFEGNTGLRSLLVKYLV